MANGEWRMANGEWRMANGEWRMANGEWRMANGEWRMANGEWRMANGEWRMAKSESLVRIGRMAANGSNQSGYEPLNFENILCKGVMRYCSLRNYLWCEGSIALEEAPQSLFPFRDVLWYMVCKMGKLNVKKLFVVVTTACLQILHCMCLYISS